MRFLVVFLLAIGAAFSQSSGSPEFEVTSVRQAPLPGDGLWRVVCDGGPGTHDPDLFTCQNMSLLNLVEAAWRIARYRVAAPDWMLQPFPMFNLSARISPNATRDQFDLMLQNLVTDRFKLSFHHEARAVAQFDLVIAKGGPKFRQAENLPSTADAGSDARPGAPQAPKVDADGFPIFPPGRVGMTGIGGKARMYQPRMSMQALATLLGGQLRSPVTDSTGLTGQYEISLYWVQQSPLRTADTDENGPTLTRAFQDQLGLRVESKKAQADFFVVDYAEKTPVEN